MIRDSRGRLPCRRCLLGDLPGSEALAALLREHLDALPSKRRASPAVTNARLAECRRCAHLSEGTCGLCGCYVEYRAALRSRRCPGVPPRWEAEPDSED